MNKMRKMKIPELRGVQQGGTVTLNPFQVSSIVDLS
jgi:hypothetical protein